MFEQDLEEYQRVILAGGFAGHAEFLQQQASRRLAEWTAGSAQGNPLGQFFLGLCYSFETAVSLDRAEAVRLFRLAAEQGCAPAQTQLALHFEEGREVDQDMEEALSWYTR